LLRSVREEHPCLSEASGSRGCGIDRVGGAAVVRSSQPRCGRGAIWGEVDDFTVAGTRSLTTGRGTPVKNCPDLIGRVAAWRDLDVASAWGVLRDVAGVGVCQQTCRSLGAARVSNTARRLLGPRPMR